jgi:hypothetical protein
MNADPTPIAADKCIFTRGLSGANTFTVTPIPSAAIGVGSAFIGASKDFPQS